MLWGKPQQLEIVFKMLDSSSPAAQELGDLIRNSKARPSPPKKPMTFLQLSKEWKRIKPLVKAQLILDLKNTVYNVENVLPDYLVTKEEFTFAYAEKHKDTLPIQVAVKGTAEANERIFKALKKEFEQ